MNEKAFRPDFIRRPPFQVKPKTILLFIVLSIAIWYLLVFGHSIFPSGNTAPFMIRTLLTFLADAIMIYASFWLLKKNNLPRTALGLTVDRKTIVDLLGGLIISIVTIALLASILYLFVPFHFAIGSLGSRQVLFDSIFYLAGNTLEELMFRGFLFILLTQLWGWRIGLLVMSVLFGFFHLQGMNLDAAGLKTVISTACFGAVFGLSFVLFRSLWTAITLHVVSNILLHAVTGLDGNGKALFAPVFEKKFPGYDIGFFIGTGSAVIVFLAMLFLLRRKGRDNTTTGL